VTSLETHYGLILLHTFGDILLYLGGFAPPQGGEIAQLKRYDTEGVEKNQAITRPSYRDGYRPETPAWRAFPANEGIR
jgi:hypothetical protein